MGDGDGVTGGKNRPLFWGVRFSFQNVKASAPLPHDVAGET
jgi:hypothetical protein